MNERAIQFGSEQHLAGVLHLPVGEAAGLPGVMIFNAGLDHRVGPKRLYVALARSLAAAGYAVLRFDGPGMGESRNPSQVGLAVDGGEEPADAAAAVLRCEAGVESLVVLGLCGGAGDAHPYALRDSGVVAEVLIDGYTYPTFWFKFRYIWHRVRSFKRWQNLIRRKFGGGDQVRAAVDAALEQEAFFDEPPHAEMAKQLQGLLNRNVGFCYIYTGDSHQWYNYRGQFRNSFSSVDFGDALTEHLLPEADHTFSRSVDRITLVKVIGQWLDARFKPGTTPPQPPVDPNA